MPTPKAKAKAKQNRSSFPPNANSHPVQAEQWQTYPVAG
jgi:hypothetical protein